MNIQTNWTKHFEDIGMFKSLIFRAVGKIVGYKTCDATFAELEKYGKFKTVLVSSSQ